MNDRVLRRVMAVLAAGALGIAGYLAIAHYTGTSVVCPTRGCETVEESRYSDLFGIPVAVLGALACAAVLLTLVRSSSPARAAGLALAVCALVFAVYLVVVQVLVLDAVCQWCLALDASIAGLAAVAAMRARADFKRLAVVTASPGPRRRPASRRHVQ